MSESFAITPEPMTSVRPPRKAQPLLAWLVILFAVGFILWRNWSATPIDKQRYDLLIAGFLGKYFIGVHQLLKTDLFHWGDSDVYEQAQKSLNRHTYAQRLRFVVLAGELKGPEEASEQLRQLNEEWTIHCGAPPEDDSVTARLLDRLYAIRKKDPAANPLSEEEQQELRCQLGWFGDLALTPADGTDSAARAAVLAPAWRTLWSLVTAEIILLGAGALGLILLVTLLVLWLVNRLRGGLAYILPHGSIYAETFALYMVLFLALSYGASWLRLMQGRLLLGGLAAVGSLAALVWPVLRGIPWRQVRQDIGWQTGRRPWLEPLLGIGCYAMALPLLLIGLLIMLSLTALRDRLGWGPDECGPSNAPGHPIVFEVASAGWWMWLEVLFVASVVAPVVEETMFRGVLYRYLREASSKLRPAMSVLVSMLVVSFLFAVIHPQGFLVVPMLMALALAFNLMREWRGTLIPSIVAHGVNNAVATVLLFLMMN